jgi:hypothetical protein
MRLCKPANKPRPAEHNLPPNTTTAPPPRSTHRPDLTSFYASLANVEVPATASASVDPIPAHVAAAAALYGDSLRQSLAASEHVLASGGAGNAGGAGGDAGGDDAGEDDGVAGDAQMRATVDLLRNMLERVALLADDPPRRVDGVPDAFLDGLERVPRARLRASDACPICAERFLDGEFDFCSVSPVCI